MEILGTAHFWGEEGDGGRTWGMGRVNPFCSPLLQFAMGKIWSRLVVLKTYDGELGGDAVLNFIVVSITMWMLHVVLYIGHLWFA